MAKSQDGCGWKYLRDMSADKLTRWLSEQVDAGMSHRVHNVYVQSWVAFGNWCIGKRQSGKSTRTNGEKRLLSNPFEGTGKLDEKADVKRKARALTANELERLLDAAERRPMIEALTIRRGPHKGVLAAKLSDKRRAELVRTGQERRLIYKTAILTGLRLNELRTLTVADLSFGDVPFLKLDANNEKSRKGSTLPLRGDLAAELKEWTAGKERTDSVFYVPSGLLRIMDRDCKAADIPKKDADGCVVHVHALRHSFGTHLSLAGVAPRTAQAAMRHSKLDLTMGVYTDSRLLDTAGAIESIGVVRQHAPQHAPTIDQTGQIESIPVQDGESKTRKNPPKPKESLGFVRWRITDLNR
jgi:integrase